MNLKSFFKRQIMVACVYGIPVRIDYRWFGVFAISVAMIAVNAHRHPMQLGTLQLPPADDLVAWTLGIAITLGLFLSVFGHELSHALMARMEGIEIEESRPDLMCEQEAFAPGTRRGPVHQPALPAKPPICPNASTRWDLCPVRKARIARPGYQGPAL